MNNVPIPTNNQGLKFPACAATLAGSANIPAPIIELMTTNAIPGAPIARIRDGFVVLSGEDEFAVKIAPDLPNSNEDYGIGAVASKTIWHLLSLRLG